MRQVEHYLKAMAEGAAEGINERHPEDIAEYDRAQAMDRAEGQRAEVIAASIGTRSTVFAREEAAKQSPFPERGSRRGSRTRIGTPAWPGRRCRLMSDWGGIAPGSELRLCMLDDRHH